MPGLSSPQPPKRNRRIPLWSFALCILANLAPVAYAANPTSTSLSALPVTSVGSGIYPDTALRITATVTDAGSPVSSGTVNFCDAAASICLESNRLATAQVISSGNDKGTATVVLRFAAGNHPLRAFYSGTTAEASSISSPVTLRAAVRTQLPSMSALTATLTGPARYTLTGTVTAFGAFSPTGSVSFIDQTNANLTVASGSVGSSTTSYGFIAAATTANFGATPTALTTADFNNDGFLDAAAFSAAGNRLFIGAGHATFSSATNLPIAGTIIAAVAADFNADGSPDLAVVTSGSPNILHVLINSGTGTFTASPTTYSLGLGSAALVTGDLNGDGILDLAVTSSASGTVTPLLGSGTGTFSASNPVSVGALPVALTLADFNADGLGDLVISSAGSLSFTVLLGSNPANFTLVPATGSPYAVPAAPGAISYADFNKDGFLDLAIVSGTTVRVYPADPAHPGQFLSATAYTLPSAISAINTGDINNDTFSDLLVTNGSSVTLLTNNGSGAFTSTTSYALGSTPSLFRYVDADTDGFLDLFAVDATGSVSFAAGQIIQTANVVATGVTFPGGGTHNIAASYSGDATYLPSLSSPQALTATPIASATTLSVSPTSIAVTGQTLMLTATITPANVGSLAPGGTVTFLESGVPIAAPVPVTAGGTASYTFSVAGGSHFYTASYSGDLNYTASVSAPPIEVDAPFATTTTLTVTPNTTPTFGDISTLTASVRAGSTPAPSGTVKFCIGSGACTGVSLLRTMQLTSATGSVTAKLRLPAGAVNLYAEYEGTKAYGASRSSVTAVQVARNPRLPDALNLAASALNAGPDPIQYAFTSTFTAQSIFPPTGTVQFIDTTNSNLVLGTAGFTLPTQNASLASSQPVYQAGSNPMKIASGDFNEDGFTDFAVTNSSGSSVTIFLNDANGVLHAAASPVSVGNNPIAVVSKDFNGDGHLDLAVANALNNTISILLGTGTGTFTPGTTISTRSTPTAMVTADFNHDGFADLAVLNYLDNSVGLMLNDGTATFSSGPVLTFGSAALSLVAADFNGDGFDDLAVGEATGAIRIFLAPTTGSFITTPSSTLSTTSTPLAMVAADLDHDGLADLAIADYLGTNVLTYYGNGGGAFVAGPVINVGTFPDNIRASDVTADGAMDLVVTGEPARLNVIAGLGGRNFFNALSLPLPATPGGIEIAAVDDDGLDDAIITLSNNALLVPRVQYTLTDPASIRATVYGGGTHSIIARFAGDSNYVPVDSAPVQVQGSRIPTTLTATAGTVTAGQTTTITATISPNSLANYTAGGAVDFIYGTTPICTAVPLTSAGTATCVTPPVPGGTYSVTISYSGDTNFAPASITLNGTVNPVDPIVVWNTPAPISYGTPLSATQLNATTSPTVAGTFVYGQPTGTVLPVGTQTLSVIFKPTDTATYNTITKTVQITVTKGLLTVTADAKTTALGQPIPPLTATIAGFVGSDTAASTVTGTPSLTVTPSNPVPAGNYPITAALGTLESSSYDFQFVNGTLTISKGAPTIGFTGPNSLAFNTNGTVTASISGLAGIAPTGSFQFFDGTTLLGSSTIVSGSAAFTVSFPTLGNHTLTAVYSGDSNYVTATSAPITINVTQQTPVITWNNPTPINYGTPLSSVQLNATTTVPGTFTYAPPAGTTLPVGNTTLSVTFTPADTTMYTTATKTVALTVLKGILSVSADSKTIALGQPVPALTYSITGYVNGDTESNSYSGAPSISLTPAAPVNAGAYPITTSAGTLASERYDFRFVPGTLTITKGTSGTSLIGPALINVNAAGTYTASITANTSIVPTGAVTFLDGATVVATVPVSGSSATAAITFATTGVHNVTAVYSGDVNYPSSTSAVVVTTVRDIPVTTVTLTGPATLGPGVTGTFTVAFTTSQPITPTGSVSLFDGSTLVTTSQVVNGAASFNASFASLGAHNLTAVYSGDVNYAAATSNVVALQVVTTTYAIATTPSVLTISPGQTAITTVRVIPAGNFNGTVTLSCTGLPEWARCSFSPETVNANGSNTILVSQMKIDTLGYASGTVTAQVPLQKDPRGTVLATVFWLPIGVLGLVLGGRRQRLSKAGKMLFSLVLSVGLLSALAGLSGCGVTNCCGIPNATSGTFPVTVTAANSTTTQTTTFTLNVR